MRGPFKRASTASLDAPSGMRRYLNCLSPSLLLSRGWRLTVTQPMAPRLEVFLSHATSDTEHVALVRRQIEALGIAVYLAEHDPKPGTVLAEKVREAIRRCHAV